MLNIRATTYTSIHWIGKPLAGLAITLALFGLAECVLRILNFDHHRREKILWNPKISGFIGTYQYFLDTQFAPPGYIWVTQPDTRYTDRFGFRLPEIPFDKPPGKIRVAFLGGSTTQGGFRPYPERAIRLINRTIGANQYEMLNVACSSYSIHQSVKAFDRWVLPRKPDVVFVYHGWNDILVTPDGYSDREKDYLISADRDPRIKLPRFISQLRLSGFLASIYEMSDRTWPRQRVSFKDFEDGLGYIAQRCTENNIRMIVMVRPSQHADLLVLEPSAFGPVQKQHMLEHYGTVEPAAVYLRQGEQVTAIQKKIAARFDHVDAFDGDRLISMLIDRQKAGEFGDGVRIFRSDNCHLYEFGDELLAQQVAMAIAPEVAAAISNQIESTGYLMDMAHDFRNEDAPREAAWFLNKALKQNENAEEIKLITSLMVTTTNEFQFADRFRAGRMGGDIHDYETKISMLKECLAEQPHDYGVMVQIYLVSFSMGHASDAAESMSVYKPIRSDYERDWLYYTLESHVEGKRLNDARTTANRLLRLDPKNELALNVIEHGLPDRPL